MSLLLRSVVLLRLAAISISVFLFTTFVVLFFTLKVVFCIFSLSRRRVRSFLCFCFVSLSRSVRLPLARKGEYYLLSFIELVENPEPSLLSYKSPFRFGRGGARGQRNVANEC